MDARDRELRAFLHEVLDRPKRRRRSELAYIGALVFFLAVALGAAVVIAIQGGR